MAKTKPFLCKNETHKLGMIVWNGDGIPQLLLYRHAVDADADHPADVDVIGPLTGRMPVKCDVCDEVRLWDVRVDALVQMYEWLNESQQAEVQRRLAKAAFE